MSGWDIGDLAVCVEAGEIHCHCAGHTIIHMGVFLPPSGVAVRVRAIQPALTDAGMPCKCGCVALQFDNGLRGVAKRFRKIRPDAHEGNVEDWRDLVEFFTKRVNA